MSLNKPEPPPTRNDRPAVWGLVIQDMIERDATGRLKYGVPLQGFNGRDALVDAYQEALDLCVYLRQLIYERSVGQQEAKSVAAKTDVGEASGLDAQEKARTES